MPDPRPLDERVGAAFFRDAPPQPGVYLMRDAADQVLYVGKAKNLRQRLQCYRVANPDRMPRRHLRMVREVARIEFQFCANESAALERESELLRSLRPRFNRAGVWPGKTKVFLWRALDQHLELAVAETSQPGWQSHGPLGHSAHPLHQTISRLVWLAMNPLRAFAELPSGWIKGKLAPQLIVHCGNSAGEMAHALAAFFCAPTDPLVPRLEAEFVRRTHPFERAMIDRNLEVLKEFSARLRAKFAAN